MIWFTFKRTLKLGAKSLWMHRLRSVLTMFGIIFGVCSVIAMLATTTVFKDTLGALRLPVELPAHGQLAYDLKGQRMLLYDPGINAIYSIPEGTDQRLDPTRWRQLPPPPLGPTQMDSI